jgi:hypothetical protein
MKEAALRLVNLARSAQGLPALAEFSKGNKRAAGSCPVARALDVECAGPGWIIFGIAGTNGYDIARLRARAVAAAWRTTVTQQDTMVPTPIELQQFIFAFDRGEYPELIAS